jgi:predicted N-acetyltransferase YhbS
MLQINEFSADDFDLIADLYAVENWGYLPSEIRRFAEWERKGCFIAKTNGQYVGHVFSISYGHLGWIGLLRVDHKYGNRGIGTELMRKAIYHLYGKGVKTIRLEAVLKAVSLYHRLGFKEEFDSLRLTARIQNVSATENTSIPKSSDCVEIRSMNNKDIASIAVMDSNYFGASRIKVLERLFQDFPNLCFIAATGGTVFGYVMCRKSASDTYKIAPWICDPERPEVAEKLLIACLRNVRENKVFALGIPAVNYRAVQIAKKCGFQTVDICRRMRLGQELVEENPRGIFGIGGSEKG